MPQPTTTRDGEPAPGGAGAFFGLARGWWRGPTSRTAWILTGSLAAVVVANIALNVAVNRWNRMFFDALERHEARALWLAVGLFLGLVVLVAGVGVLTVRIRETLQVRWREWLVGRLMSDWLSGKRYYRLELAGDGPANPEYRIADDSRMATEPLVDFAIGILHAVLTALAFVSILWAVGGSLRVEIGGVGVTIPAYMTLAALLYALVASWLAVRIGRPLIRGVAAKNEAEARLRFELTRVRENAESIALVRGEADERRLLASTYASLVGRWLHVVVLHGRLTWITNGSGALVPVVPLLLATPKFLSGELSLGAVTQLAGAFVQVQVAVAWIVDNYKAVAGWRASADRVTALAERLGPEPPPGTGPAPVPVRPAIRIEPSPDGSLVLDGLTVEDRAGRVLVADARTAIAPGERVLLVGESGLGKSTLVRAVAGLWPWGRGRILVPSDRLALVPQRPYLPLGPLKRALVYPGDEAEVPDGAAAEVLEACGLGSLVPKLAVAERWDQILSSGERQRLAFARLVLQHPAAIILDEATSALDEEAQARLMALLVERLPAATILSIGHRAGLEAFHDRCVALRRGEGGARLVEAPFPRPALVVA